MTEDKIINCSLCGGKTTMLGTKLCDPCWELSRRIEAAPDLALEILTKLNETPLPPRRPATKIEIEAMGAICNLQDELHEAHKIIRGLLTDLSPGTREQAIRKQQAAHFLKQHKQSDLQEK